MKRTQLRIITCCLVIGTSAALLMSTAACSSKTAVTSATNTAIQTTSAAAITTATTSTALASATTYTNPLYKVKTLAQWTVNATNAKDITVNSPDPNTYVRVITAVNPVTSLDSYLATCVSLFKFEFPSYAQQSPSKITVNGLPAYSLNVTFTKDGVPLKGVLYVIVKGTQGYCAVGMTTPTLWSRYSSNLTTVLNSLSPN